MQPNLIRALFQTLKLIHRFSKPALSRLLHKLKAMVPSKCRASIKTLTDSSRSCLR